MCKCVRFDFLSDLTISLETDLARFRNSNPAGARYGFAENLFSDTLDNGVNNAVSYYKEAVQFSAVLPL